VYTKDKMEYKRRENRKRLAIDIPEGTHKSITHVARLYNITLTKLIIRLIMKHLAWREKNKL
jgi:hypothetical protein